MDTINTSPGKGRLMNFSPSSGYLEQDFSPKYRQRKYKIPKSDVRGQSAFDSYLEGIKQSPDWEFTTDETQSLKKEIFDLTWE